MIPKDTEDFLMKNWYVLDEEHNVVPCQGMKDWKERYYESSNRVVKKTFVGKQEVSTVFLGMDHGFSWIFKTEENRPVVFETMVFGGKSDEFQERYCTWDEAVKGHDEVVRKLKNNEEL
jgi:hypothetical protein